MEAPATPLWATIVFVAGLLLRLAAGGSILLKAVRLRGLPELLIGLFVLLLAAGELGVVMVTRLRGVVAPGPIFAFSALSLGLVVIAQIALVEALRRIFHPASVPARLFAWALAAAILAAGVARIVPAGRSFVVTDPGLASLSLLLVALVIDLWWSAESLVFGRRLRRRAALGLADARLVPRFDLWAVAALSHACMFACLLLCALVWRRAAAEIPAVLAVIGATGSLSALAMYGSFHTPRFLLRRIEARERAAA